MSHELAFLNAAETSELLDLVPLLRDGGVSEDQVVRLEELVCQRKDGRWTYLRAVNIVAGLQWCFAPDAVRAPLQPADVLHDGLIVGRILNDAATGRASLSNRIVHPLGALRWFPADLRPVWTGLKAWIGRSATVATLLVAAVFYGSFVMLAWNLWPQTRPSDGGEWRVGSAEAPRDQMAAEGSLVVAKLVGLHDARWQPELARTALATGASVRVNEPLALSSGLVELRLMNGTKIVAEGPCSLKLVTENALQLGSGKMTARVPENAIGFAVETPQATIVDLGTEFGIAVTNDGATEVHVIKGLVATRVKQAAAPIPKPVHLRSGQAVRIKSTGPSANSISIVKEIAADAGRFVHGLPQSDAGTQNAKITIEAGDGTAQFVFPTLPSPSNKDLADAALGQATIRAIGDLWDSAPAEALLDGKGDVGNHVRFRPGTQGMFVVDLGQRVRVDRVVSFSWHVDGPPVGAPQVFDLFGSDAEQAPSLDGYLPSRGWRYLASINTESQFGAAPKYPSQQAVSVSGPNGLLGEFHHLLWVVQPWRDGTTFYDVLDVYGDSVESTKPQQ